MHETARSPYQIGRIEYLDGLRCFSIMAVLFFHYFNSWAMPQLEICPYGELLAGPFKYGYLGVEMFFMISGLVIMMTLARCRSWQEFAVRRAARLVPAMIFYSLLTFCIVTAFAPNVFQVSALGFIPSWLFIMPEFLNWIFKTSQFNSIDSAYWSLYVEVKFYIMIGALYFLSGKNFYRNTLAFFIATFFLSDLFFFMGWESLHSFTSYVSAPKYFPWFLIGIGFYLFLQSGMRLYCAAFIAAGVVQLWVLALMEPSATRFITPVLLPLLFFAVLQWRPLQGFLSWRPFVAVGVASYGLYLFHQYAGLVLIQNIAEALGLTGWPSVSVAVAVTGVFIGFTMLVFRFVEYPLNRWAVNRWAAKR